VSLLNFDDDVADDSGHDSHGSDSDVLGCCESPVENETDEASIEAILGRQFGEKSIRHTLGNDHEADRDTCDYIAKEPCEIVVEYPVPEGKETSDITFSRTR
jgi:hypothetical protein